MLEFEAPTLSVYPRETVVAEKFQAMVMLGISNSRMKDFYDIWKLANDFDFDGELLSNAIAATFDRRQTKVPASPPLCLTTEFSEDDQKMNQWNAFCKKTGLDIGGLSLAEIVGRLENFLMPISVAVANKTSFNSNWPQGGPWSN